MELKAGYKQTEVGVIPEDWEAVKIESIISGISMGPFGSDIKVSNFISEGIPVLSGANIRTERLTDKFVNFVSPEKARSLKKAVAHRGDIVVTHRGTLGQISYIPEDSEFDCYVISQSQFRIRFIDSRVIPSWVVLYFLSRNGAKNLLERKGHTGVPAIAQPTKTFRNLHIPLPILPEQTAIANALSDADALIQSLTHLIAKKRQIKQGAMQTLLNPYENGCLKEGWVVKRLGDCVKKFVGGGTPSRSVKSYWGKEIPWVTVKDITTFNSFSTQEYITKDGLKNSATNLIPKGTIIISTRIALGKAVLYEVDVCINQDLKAIFPNADIDVHCFRYWLEKNSSVIEQLGSGSTVMGVSLEDLKKIEYSMPDKLVQTRIATILSDMDAEIAALESKLAKYQQIKQGMMQNLLTGKIRLVTPQKRT